MDIQLLSKRYTVRKILDEDIPSVLNLCESNPMYYEYCPPKVSLISIKSDLTALPPYKSWEDKYYIGFFEGAELIAVMDLIFKFPKDETVFIGFFMVDKKLQGRGVGSSIIAECLQVFKFLRYKTVRLGCVKDNPQAEAFWKKNQFEATGAESKKECYTVIVMEKAL